MTVFNMNLIDVTIFKKLKPNHVTVIEIKVRISHSVQYKQSARVS